MSQESGRYLLDLKRKKLYPEALREVELLRQQGEGGRWLDVTEAEVRAQLGQPGPALELLERCHLQQPLPEYGLCLMAGLLEACRRPDEAARHFEDLAGRPRLHEATARRVLRYLEKVDRARALSLARRLGPQDAGSSLNLIRQLQKEKLADEALALAEKACQRFPGEPRLKATLIDLQVADIPPDQAAEEWEMLLELKENRNNKAMLSRLVQAYRKAGRLEEARRALVELLQQEPDNLFLKSNMAYVLRDLGQLDAALEMLEQVIQADPKDFYASSAYFSSCRKHHQQARAAAFIRRSGLKQFWSRLKGKSSEVD